MVTSDFLHTDHCCFSGMPDIFGSQSRCLAFIPDHQSVLYASQARVSANVKKLSKHGLPVTERELTMLAYGVDQLVQMGRDPDAELLIVQVDTCFGFR